jgi:hypothetical protein
MNWRSPSSIDLPTWLRAAAAFEMNADDGVVVTDIWFRNPTRAIRAGSGASITFRQYARIARLALVMAGLVPAIHVFLI